MKQLLILLTLITTFNFVVIGQQLNDSIMLYQKQLSNTNNLYFVNFKLGQLYYLKVTSLSYEQFQKKYGNQTEIYYHNYLDTSIFYFNTSIKLNKKYAPSFYYRGLAQHHNKKEDELIDKIAIKDFTSAIKLNPKNALYYYERANYTATEKPKNAIKDYSKVIDLTPMDCKGYLGRASISALFGYKVSAKQRLQIETDYEKALQLKCDSSEVLLSRGITRIYDLKDYVGAIADLTIIINKPQKFQPNLLRAYYERGSAYFLNKEFDLACNDFKKWKELGGAGWVYYIKESCGIDYETWTEKK